MAECYKETYLEISWNSENSKKHGSLLKREINGEKNYIILFTIVGSVSTTPTGIKRLLLLSI